MTNLMSCRSQVEQLTQIPKIMSSVASNLKRLKKKGIDVSEVQSLITNEVTPALAKVKDLSGAGPTDEDITTLFDAFESLKDSFTDLYESNDLPVPQIFQMLTQGQGGPGRGMEMMQPPMMGQGNQMGGRGSQMSGPQSLNQGEGTKSGSQQSQLASMMQMLLDLQKRVTQ